MAGELWDLAGRDRRERAAAATGTAAAVDQVRTTGKGRIENGALL